MELVYPIVGDLSTLSLGPDVIGLNLDSCLRRNDRLKIFVSCRVLVGCGGL